MNRKKRKQKAFAQLFDEYQKCCAVLELLKDDLVSARLSIHISTPTDSPIIPQVHICPSNKKFPYDCHFFFCDGISFPTCHSCWNQEIENMGKAYERYKKKLFTSENNGQKA